MSQNFFQSPTRPENQLWLDDGYTWRSEKLPELEGQMNDAVAEIQLIVSEGGGDQGWAELRSRVVLFGAGNETFADAEFPDRLEMDVQGDPVLVRTDTPEAQPIDIFFKGVLIDEARMRDKDDPARFRLQIVDKEEILYGPPPEAVSQVTGSLHGQLSIRGDERPVLVLKGAILELSALDFPDFSSIKLELEAELRLDWRFEVAIHESPEQLSSLMIAAPSPTALRRTRRVLKYQCVFFSNGEQTSGQGVQAEQMTAAQNIWDGACLTLEEVKPPKIVDKATLVASNDIDAIVGSYTPSVGVIPIFFVHHPLNGGGATPTPWGRSLTRIVVSDMTSGRDPVTSMA